MCQLDRKRGALEAPSTTSIGRIGPPGVRRNNRGQNNNSLAIAKQNDDDIDVDCAEAAIEIQKPLVEPALSDVWSGREVDGRRFTLRKPRTARSEFFWAGVSLSLNAWLLCNRDLKVH
jgi:hypothetical protein